MFELKEIKKMRSYFNGFMSNRNDYKIRFSKLEDGNLLSVVNFDKFSIRYIVPSIDNHICHTFNNILVSFSDFYDVIANIKGIKNIDICYDTNFFIKITEEECFNLQFETIKTRDFFGSHLGTVNVEGFTNAINLNSSNAKNGIAVFDSNIVMSIVNHKLYINSYAPGMYIGNKVDIINDENFDFMINNKKISLLKKWLNYANDPRKIDEDNLDMFIYNLHLSLCIKNISIIFPVETNRKNICDKFRKITDFDFPSKKSVKFRKIMDCISIANKEKNNEVNLEEIFEHSSMIYRPLISNVCYQLSDLDGNIRCDIINSKNDVIQIKHELPYLKSCILLFSKKIDSPHE